MTINRSLKAEIMLRLLVPVIIFFIIESVLSYFVTLYYADQAYDKWLLDSARSLMQEIEMDQGTIKANFPPEALEIFKWDDQDKTYFKIISENQGMIAGEKFVPEAMHESVDWSIPNYFNDIINGEPVRVVSMMVPRADLPEKVFVHVAETLNKRHSMTADILLADLIPQIILAILIGFYLFKAVGRGLYPLYSLADEISQRSPRDLSPISKTHVFKEIHTVIDTINDLLTRLEAVIESQQRFIANAAHQLRTPLAGLKLQAERAMREDNLSQIKPAFVQIKNSADRISHLISQLLVLARSGLIDSSSVLESINLKQLAREVCMEWAPKSLNKKMELIFEGSDNPVFIMGDDALLRELLSNLIDNAISYGRENDMIIVKLYERPHPRLVVEDSGPGIPKQEHDKVFERFYRIDGSEGNGCGLGLAIVKEIADLHKAGLILSEKNAEGGTRIEISFPGLDLSGTQSKN